MLLVWEIGKPWRLACADVDRGLDGVRWYVGEIERQLATARAPLPGPVSNIASWNYPMSVQVHAELVQPLAGNAVMAKTPSQGGFHCLTVAHALMPRAGLPVTLLSGRRQSSATRSSAAPRSARSPSSAGASNGRKAAATPGRHRQAAFPRAGGSQRLGYLGLQRLGAAGRASAEGLRVRQAALHRVPPVRRPARLFPDSSRCTCRSSTVPAFRSPARRRATSFDPAPRSRLRPVISAGKAAELASSSTRRSPAGPSRSTAASSPTAASSTARTPSAYVAPACCSPRRHQLVAAPRRAVRPARHRRRVDTENELLAAMNAVQRRSRRQPGQRRRGLRRRTPPSNCRRSRSAINKPRTRGDREEPFGGRGASWKGAFVGGDLLVQAVTYGRRRGERLFGNFPDYSQFPSR